VLEAATAIQRTQLKALVQRRPLGLASAALRRAANALPAAGLDVKPDDTTLRRTFERDCGPWRETTRSSPAESRQIFSAAPACDGPRRPEAPPQTGRFEASAAPGNGGTVHAGTGVPGRFAGNAGQLATTTSAAPRLCRMNCNSDKEDALAEKNARNLSTSRADSAASAQKGQGKRLDATPRSADAEGGPRERAFFSRVVKSRGGGFSSCSETLFSWRRSLPTLIAGRPRRHHLPPYHPDHRQRSGLVLNRR
jgi:hypothetical protein